MSIRFFSSFLCKVPKVCSSNRNPLWLTLPDLVTASFEWKLLGLLSSVMVGTEASCLARLNFAILFLLSFLFFLAAAALFFFSATVVTKQ